MIQNQKHQAAWNSPPRDTVGNIAALSDRLGLSTVPAAWPIGVSQLALAIGACQSCETAEVCTDWLARAPHAIDAPPAFCPNAPTFERAKQAKER